MNMAKDATASRDQCSRLIIPVTINKDKLGTVGIEQLAGNANMSVMALDAILLRIRQVYGRQRRRIVATAAQLDVVGFQQHVSSQGLVRIVAARAQAGRCWKMVFQPTFADVSCAMLGVAVDAQLLFRQRKSR